MRNHKTEAKVSIIVSLFAVYNDGEMKKDIYLQNDIIINGYYLGPTAQVNEGFLRHLPDFQLILSLIIGLDLNIHYTVVVIELGKGSVLQVRRCLETALTSGIRR